MDALPDIPQSPFSIGAPAAALAGFHVLPIRPGTKAPGSFLRDQWGGMGGWALHARAPVPPSVMKNWLGYPDAGIGFLLGTDAGDGMQSSAVDFDIDDPDAIAILRAALPASPMAKTAARGITIFFRSPPEIVSRGYDIDGKRAVDLLCKGRQTVMPPTIHPQGMPYRYVGNGLVPASQLPILGPAELEALETALRSIGWQPATSAAATVESAAGGPLQPREDSDDVASDHFRRIKDAALANFDAWVPALGLPNLVATGGGGYAATAFWRPSGTNQALVDRKPNLSFHRTGISDFGGTARGGKIGEGYSALDVVMKAKGMTLSSATEWLGERLGLNDDDDILDLDKIAESRRARATETLALHAAPLPLPENDDRPDTRLVWDDRAANATPFPWMVKGLFPAKGVSVLYGQSGSGKSFVALELAACVATGQPFFEQRIKASGGTLFALGEASGAMRDRKEGLRIGRFGDVDQVDAITGARVDINHLPIVSTPVANLSSPAIFADFHRLVRQAAKDMQARHGCPLRLIVVDTVVASFGFPDDPDATKVTGAMKALDSIAQELGLCVVAVHHAGKNKESGEHGSYAWRGSAETSVSVDRKEDSLNDRSIAIKKNRHAGNEGWSRPFALKSVTLGTDEDGEDITSAIVEPGGGGAGANDNLPATLLSGAAKRFLKAMRPVFDGARFALPSEDESGSIECVYLSNVRTQYIANSTERKDSTVRKAFRRDLDQAKRGGHVDFQGDGDDEIVWYTRGIVEAA